MMSQPRRLESSVRMEKMIRLLSRCCSAADDAADADADASRSASALVIDVMMAVAGDKQLVCPLLRYP